MELFSLENYAHLFAFVPGYRTRSENEAIKRQLKSESRRQI
jgi:hypothetical protein